MYSEYFRGQKKITQKTFIYYVFSKKNWYHTLKIGSSLSARNNSTSYFFFVKHYFHSRCDTVVYVYPVYKIFINKKKIFYNIHITLLNVSFDVKEKLSGLFHLERDILII